MGVGAANESDCDSSASQQASGGSGGRQLTRSLEDTGSAAPLKPVDAVEDAPLAEPPEGAGSAVTAATRGPQDTHSQQGGFAATGPGAAQTGANKKPADPGSKK